MSFLTIGVQKAAVRGNYEAGNQAFSKRLRFLTTRVACIRDRAVRFPSFCRRFLFVCRPIDKLLDL
jgi:hypothetical protein